MTILQELQYAVKLDPSAADGVDLSGRWGYIDGTSNARRDGSQFPVCSREFTQYHSSYNAGLKLRQQLFGDVTAAQLRECAWFDEIGGAADLPMVRMTPTQMIEIERERPGEWEYCNRAVR